MKIPRRSLLLGLAFVPVAALPIKGVKSRPSFPKGTIMMFQQARPPSDWHEMTVAEMPRHTHCCVHDCMICGPAIVARKT